MIDFLLKSAIGLIVFLGFYHLTLEREKMHRFNRFFLLFSIVISIVIPFVSFEIIKEVPAVISNQIVINEPIVNSVHAIEKIDYTLIALWSFYFVVTLILVLRFAINIQKIISKTKVNSIVDFKNSKLILVEEKIVPHTFLNYIFINSEEYKNKNIEAELFTHELVHVTQKHTLDILFIEVLKTIFWFNPIFIFYKKAIQLNHEFLADQEIVKTYDNVPFYQNLLLSKGNGKHTIFLASNLNYSVTKKRLTMMKKTTSKNTAFTKKFAVLPVLVILMAFLCIKTVAQEVKADVSKSVLKEKKEVSSKNTVISNQKKDTITKEKQIKKPKKQKGKSAPLPPPPPPPLKKTKDLKSDSKTSKGGLNEETSEKKKEYKKSYGYRKMDFDTTMFRKPSQH